MFYRKRPAGAALLLIGCGMMIQFLMPAWGFMLALILIALGLWKIFFSIR